MLLEFGARNFFSFKEGFCVSFEVDGNCPKSISKGKPYVTILGLKGANAAGKTNILRALSFIRYLCSESYNSAPKSEIPIDNFYNNDDSTELFCRFAIEGNKYLYETGLTKDKILYEELSFDGTDNFIFKRHGNTLDALHEDFSELKQLKIRSNVSVIHSAKQGEYHSLEKFYSFFANIITNVSDFGLNNFHLDLSLICEIYRQNSDLLSKVKTLLNKADTGVVDVKIVRSMSPQLKTQFIPVFIHEKNEKKYPVSVWHESSGTKKLFYDLSLYYGALEAGGILVLDEFDIHLHPALLPMLIDLFDSDEKNDKSAQMIFSTHDTAIMDRLGKYRTYLVNKEDNESFGYRLDEIPGDILQGDLRNDRPISHWYKKGKLGGLPKAGCV